MLGFLHASLILLCLRRLTYHLVRVCCIASCGLIVWHNRVTTAPSCAVNLVGAGILAIHHVCGALSTVIRVRVYVYGGDCDKQSSVNRKFSALQCLVRVIQLFVVVPVDVTCYLVVFVVCLCC